MALAPPPKHLSRIRDYDARRAQVRREKDSAARQLDDVRLLAASEAILASTERPCAWRAPHGHTNLVTDVHTTTLITPNTG